MTNFSKEIYIKFKDTHRFKDKIFKENMIILTVTKAAKNRGTDTRQNILR